MTSSKIESTSKYDEEQIKFMEEDMCIVLDENDKAVDQKNKKFCHLIENIDTGKALHRAFSVFMFDSKDRLLLQQRAGEKITFPLMWTNTCCSHPLHNYENERLGADEKYAQHSKEHLGVVYAARRKLEHELGMKPENIDLDKFEFMTRIMYRANCDETWAENEIDYCLMYKSDNDSKLVMVPNKNEVEDVKYVSKEELISMMNDKSLVFTPWFKLIVEKFLFKWWDAMQKGESLESHKDIETIHSL